MDSAISASGGTTLSLESARALHLAAQGLIGRADRPATKRDVLNCIRRMGALQIDSISVVARSPYLVLWSRLGQYDRVWLDELLEDGKLFEFWSHAACFLPIEDWPLYRRDMLERGTRLQHWLEAQDEVIARVLGHLEANGAVRSSQWTRADGAQSAGWWDWKPEKLALEALFATGRVMVRGRKNFQRIYDLQERVLPTWDDANLPPAEETRRALAVKAVRALGVAPARWVPDYFRRPVKGTADLLESLAAEGTLLRAQVEGWEAPAYVHPDHAPLLRRAARGKLHHEGTALLSPFDPVVWHRTRLLEFWNFHYRIEVYTPAEQRQYGYFTLPILHHGRLIGRLDPKAHRARRVLEIRRLHLEEGFEPNDTLVRGLAQTVRDFATWQELDQIEWGESDTPGFVAMVRGAVEDMGHSPT